jgi:hypothetical protein
MPKPTVNVLAMPLRKAGLINSGGGRGSDDTYRRYASTFDSINRTELRSIKRANFL